MFAWTERSVRVGSSELKLREAGEGRPLLILHDELGPTAPVQWQEALARDHRLIMPLQPGFFGERIHWLRNIRDLSCFYGHFLRDLTLEPVDVLGFSMGGWIAAEMAVNNPAQFSKMALVAPFGIKPQDGYIMDFFPMPAADYIAASAFDGENVAEVAELYGAKTVEQYESWEDARTESARLAWEPFVHDPSLEHLLEALHGLPSLVIWGDKDAVLPESAVQAYRRAIPECHLEIFRRCGHRPEIEQREKFVEVVSHFLDQN